MQILQQFHQIIIHKDRERQRDQCISEQWKQARIIFFSDIIMTVKDAGATENEQRRIIQLFTNKKQDQNQKITFKQSQLVGTRFEGQIKKMELIFNSMQQQFKKKLKDCSPIQQIIQSQCSSLLALKIIYTQQNSNFNISFTNYSVSAFVFFEIVYKNKHLSQVTLKGVSISQFQQFIRQLNLAKNHQEHEIKMAQFRWMRNFNPSKFIKLSMEAKISLSSLKQKSLSLINDLRYFESLFQYLSDIEATINLSQWATISEWSTTLEYQLISLKNIRQLSVRISATEYFAEIAEKQISFVRSALFGQLSFFQNIRKLAFINVSFSCQIDITQFIALQQIINALFQQNQVTHLILDSCKHFPVLPQINTLSQVYFNWVSFRKKSDLLEELSKNNQKLCSIQLSLSSQQWRIDQDSFNKLQTLNIRSCDRITSSTMSQQPSSIKYLRFNNSSIGNVDNLTIVLPKLLNLLCLQLKYVDFKDQLIHIIPSVQLQQFVIYYNSLITNKGLQYIDQKWPDIRCIEVKNCINVNEAAWDTCKFKGLFELKVNSLMLGIKKRALEKLKSRGIKVFYD